MTNKEKEKIFYQTLKEISRSRNWKFKSYFIFRQLDNLFYESNFYTNFKENRIWGWSAFKPYTVDNVFWEITEMPENKDLPLSFRAEGAFTFRAYNYYEFNLQLQDSENPRQEIETLIDTIEEKLNKITKEVSTTQHFLKLFEESALNACVEKIVCLVELEKYQKAIEKIEYYRKNDIPSGFMFGKKDFYDLAEDFCLTKLKM